ncbi:hypothetical protein [Holospora curviuscula]|uniref:hypothetical protein n=1 Tax=Holospora curviuscula TaxID=1082868 RepID=UPI001A9CA875|nr:hypothetical protein [Holospora curviuscula]
MDTQGTLVHATVHDANQRDTVRGCNVFQEAMQSIRHSKAFAPMPGMEKPCERF